MIFSISPDFNHYTIEQWNTYLSNKDKIDLVNMNLDDAAISNLATVLKTNKTICLIDLSDNKITQIGACTLAEAVRENTYFGYNLQENIRCYHEISALKLDNNCLKKEGVLVLIKVFRETYRSLLGFSYENNGLTAEEEDEVSPLVGMFESSKDEFNTVRWTS